MWIVIGTIAIVIATITGGLLLDRRFSILPRRERLQAGAKRALPGHVEGEAPATAILVTIGELERLRRRRCPRCKHEHMDVGADDEILYEGRTLHVLSFTCGKCAAKDRVYVELAPSRA